MEILPFSKNLPQFISYFQIAIEKTIDILLTIA